MSIRFEKRIEAVKSYLSGDKSLRGKAAELGIHYNTLLRWVKWYNGGGEEELRRKRKYRRPWNRVSPDVEERVIRMREKNPNLTLNETRALLDKQGLELSIKGIWNIWKRYGCAGFERDRISNDFEDFVPILPETRRGILVANECVKQGKIKKAAEILNALPSCPDGKILEEIPDRYLTPKRKLEKLSFLFGKIPYTQYRRKVKNLREEFLNEGYHYSALWAGIKEILVLEWLGKPKEQLELIKELKQILGKERRCLNTPLWFTLNASEFIAHIRLMEIENAVCCLKECKKLSRTFSSPSFLRDLATLYSYLGYYREMGTLLEKVLLIGDVDEKKSLSSSLAYVKSNEADYRLSIRILKNIHSSDDAFTFFVKAQCYLGRGRIEQAKELAQTGLLKAKKMGIIGYMSTASLILAEANSALREKQKARLLLLRYIDLLKKLGMNEAVVSREVILNKPGIPEGAKKIRTIHLALLLRNAAQSGKTSDYKKAYQFAKRYKLLGVFHRLVLLIPEPVLKMLKKGKGTGLPRAILNLPVFRTDVPVYTIKFLGNLIVHKNQQYLKTKFTPKDTAFLIYIVSSRAKTISLDKIYRNFWPQSKSSPRNLAHLLVRIRKSLRLPSHYLYIKENRLFFDCYFTTDYGEYREHIVQAKALLRAGEWGFAKREYLQAFKLFRGEPFRKMYDDWSDDKRLEVLFSYETEVLSFTKELRARGKDKEAKKLLKKAERIVPLERELNATL